MSPAAIYISAFVARLSHPADDSLRHAELVLDEEIAEDRFIASLTRTHP